MAPWRYLVLSLAIVAFLLAAAGSPDVASGLPVLGALLHRVGQGNPKRDGQQSA